MKGNKEQNEFIKVNEVIPMHIQRYNNQIYRLLEVEDYTEDDLLTGKITKRQYYTARERKIKAYSDCIATIIQKEKVLQFHNTGFEFEVVEEKIEIKETKTKFDPYLLTFDECLEMHKLIEEAKEQQNYLPPITVYDNVPETKLIDNDNMMAEVVNVELIKHEQPPVPNNIGSAKLDPIQKLKDSINRLAAKKFKEAGGTLDEDEEKLIDTNT
jgi:hypothetical protein